MYLITPRQKGMIMRSHKYPNNQNKAPVNPDRIGQLYLDHGRWQLRQVRLEIQAARRAARSDRVIRPIYLPPLPPSPPPSLPRWRRHQHRRAASSKNGEASDDAR
jgi:hypothetical protein